MAEEAKNIGAEAEPTKDIGEEKTAVPEESKTLVMVESKTCLNLIVATPASADRMDYTSICVFCISLCIIHKFCFGSRGLASLVELEGAVRHLDF